MFTIKEKEDALWRLFWIAYISGKEDMLTFYGSRLREHYRAKEREQEEYANG